MSFEFIQDALNKRDKAGLLRARKAVSSNKQGMIDIAGKHYINFASNDYLGLSQHEQVLQTYVEGLAIHGGGSGASSVVTGYSIEHEALENDLCEVLNKPAAILFSSGFAANQAICHALAGNKKPTKPTKGSADTSATRLICDKYMHASFIQGALETQAPFQRFLHNDISHAQRLIENSNGDTLVATEGVFSMDGDCGDIAGLQQLIKNQAIKPWLMVDDAHAIGVIGERGFGSVDRPSDTDNKGVDPNKVDIVLGTFGKALGTSGAFIAGSYSLIEYLLNFSKHYVYSTAFSAAQARATRASIALVAQGQEREKLHTNIALFKRLITAKGLPLLASNSAIQPIILGSPTHAVQMSEKLAELGIWVPAIRTPTVPVNSDRIRITLSAIHTEQDVCALVDSLCIAYEQIEASGQANTDSKNDMRKL
jgi:8-amino-7-oxononanoate synthase